MGREGLNHNRLCLEGLLSGVIQSLATESPLKKMRKSFYFNLKSLFVLKIFKFLSRIYGHM